MYWDAGLGKLVKEDLPKKTYVDFARRALYGSDAKPLVRRGCNLTMLGGTTSPTVSRGGGKRRAKPATCYCVVSLLRARKGGVRVLAYEVPGAARRSERAAARARRRGGERAAAVFDVGRSRAPSRARRPAARRWRERRRRSVARAPSRAPSSGAPMARAAASRWPSRARTARSLPSGARTKSAADRQSVRPSRARADADAAACDLRHRSRSSSLADRFSNRHAAHVFSAAGERPRFSPLPRAPLLACPAARALAPQHETSREHQARRRAPCSRPCLVGVLGRGWVT